MSVFRVEKNKNYTVMSNYHLRDKRLSLKAKGLLSLMLSLPKEWDYSINGLITLSKDGRDGVRAALNELKTAQYVSINKFNDKKGMYKYKYLVYYLPYPKWLEMSKLTRYGFPVTGYPSPENPTQINNNNKIDKIDKTSGDTKSHNNLTIELLNKKYLNEEDYLDYYDNLFNDLLERGYSYSDIYSSLHYIIPRVLSRNFIAEDGKKIENKFGYLKNALESNLNRFNKDASELWDDLDDLIQ